MRQRRGGSDPRASDLTSRGVGLTHPQRRHADRLARRRRILASATDWAVSTGMMPPAQLPRHAQTKRRAA